MSEFEALSKARATVKAFVRLHRQSVDEFYQPDLNLYKITKTEARIADISKLVQGLTSTFTCLESQLESQPDEDVRKDLAKRLDDFTNLALAHTDSWESGGSAWIYCRVRSLAAATRYSQDALLRNIPAARQLLDQAWDGTEHQLGGSYGIRELTGKPGSEQQAIDYSANAYLTYWTLLTMRRLRENLIQSDSDAEDHDMRVKAATDWMTQTLAEQVAFHADGSPHADPQQLAYAVAGVILSLERADLVKNTRAYDLVHRGLTAFFEQQSERGDWSRGKPLFNYLHSGNAYCYSYETLAELLALATDQEVKARVEYMAMLKPHWRQLMRAFNYANETALPLGGPGEVGWGSGHQPHRVDPEGWATASVFRFGQRLRRLLGIWTAAEARALLEARSTTKTREQLAVQGGTWNTGFGGAGVQLATSWLLPLIASGKKITDIVYDPDETVIPKNDGRSAILYGPPGTGKTSMVETLAGELNWPFVEITPAHFLNEGIDQVSARADTIFRQMMELDRCVILLDEIDELVQNRVQSAEALERFFTTTMLPRLAKLWEMGKVLFFVNTNNVLDIDAAIRRSSRFDAAILVLPPGLESKTKALEEARLKIDKGVAPAVQKLLNEQREARGDDPNIDQLIWFPLLRFDQFASMRRLLIEKQKGETSLAATDIAEALVPIGNALLTQDWINSANGRRPDHAVARVIEDVQKLVAAQRRDSNLRTLVITDLPALKNAHHQAEGIWLVDLNGSTDIEEWATTNQYHIDPGGSVTEQ